MPDMDKMDENELLKQSPDRLSDKELVYAALWGPRRGGGWIQSLHEELLQRLQSRALPTCPRCQGVLLQHTGLCPDCASVDRTLDLRLKEHLAR
uniref:Uncharacterized protein n=1 Tax=viral metagenome TaxID=1070528 RepID=A0A6H1Z988_9ZZZZ